MGKQPLRCGTSVAANYRAACRARSRAEFASKLRIVVEEADESMLWLELLADSGIVPQERLDSLHGEARELTALFTAAQHTTRDSRRQN
jgi:four helix bundle protein